MDRKDITHAAFLDLSKAFDLISHSIFLSKLASLGFSSSAVYLIQSYLVGRKQRVKVNGVFSDWATRGVPQGTILGPLFFNMYVNDVMNYISIGCKISQYADYCLVFASGKNSQEVLKRH